MDRKKNGGHVAVEAVIILPIAVLSTLLLLYLALFLFSVQVFKQHWRLHSSYYKKHSHRHICDEKFGDGVHGR